MGYIANENDVKGTVQDFITFCDFIEIQKPPATPKGGLTLRACYDVNKLLRYPEKDAKATDRMYQYSAVSLWFYIATEAGLIECKKSKGSKLVYNTTDVYSCFMQMNVFSQYMLIFNIWYCYVNIVTQYNNTISAHLLWQLMDKAFSELSQHGYTQWIHCSGTDTSIYDGLAIQGLMNHFYKTVHNFMDLDLLVFKTGDRKSRYNNYPVIEKLKLTRFGDCVMAACKEREYRLFNVCLGEEFFLNIVDSYEEQEELVEDEPKAFLTPFLSFFAEGCIDSDTINKIINGKDNNDCLFELKVSLKKDCYRIIHCSAEHTFEQLQLAILDAFGFDNDHLYSFYLDGRASSNYSINSPDSNLLPFTDEVRLGEARLRQNQRILYLFDYGAHWEFDIIVNIEASADGIPKEPVIIKSIGEAPEQYPYYDDLI